MTPGAVADHELLRVIGRGAYGEVWLARHTRLGTLRAVKIVRRDSFGDARPFQREFEGIRRYEPISRGHPNLVSILHVGGTEDCFYYVMELADAVEVQSPKSKAQGQSNVRPSILDVGLGTLDSRTHSPHTLRSELKQHGPLPIGRCLEIGHALASALAHLHAHKLVHRDVKPSNVIFVGGMPKLADIGLVAGVDDARSFVGTEGYIPPEGPGTPSADCYSLGKLLYELSTSHDRTAWPEPPANLATRPDRERLLELNAILHRACAPDLRERYVNAAAMLAELQSLQAGQSVKRQRAWQRGLNHAKKFSLATAALALVSVVVYSLFVWKSRPGNVDRSKNEVANADIGWSTNEEANALCREGWNAFHQNAADSFKIAVGLFERALALDPTFARAHARFTLASTWNDPTNPDLLAKARPHAELALQLEPRLDEAHVAVCGIKWLLMYDWKGADREALEAIRLNPTSDGNYYAYAGPLSITGHHTEAVEQVEKALRLSSPSFISEQFAAWVYFGARKYDQTIRLINDIINRQSSRRAGLAFLLVPAYRENGDYPKAIELEKEIDLLSAKNPDAVKARYDALGNAFATGGPAGYWQKRLERDKNGTNLVWLATLYARVDDKENAFHYLDLAAEKMPTQLCMEINREPGFDSLRSDPHFRAILTKFGFPD